MEQHNYLFRGWLFSPEEMERVKDIVAGHGSLSRRQVAEIVCERLNWRDFSGSLKVIAALEALRRMEEKGFLTLPPGKPFGGYHQIRPLTAQEVGFNEPREKLAGSIETMGQLHFELTGRDKEKLWRYLIQRYHYLGYRRLVGRHLKYFVHSGDTLVSLLGFSDGIYHFRLRDRWLGWDKTTREARRHLVINNSRFLILPWVKIENLGSKVLSRAAAVVPRDWEARYGYRPHYMETFVEAGRFRGTVYKAANWQCLGQSRGKGRRGFRYFFHGKIRDYYIYPLWRP